MVAAARLRRAQTRILEARPYATSLENVLRSVAARVGGRRHPLLEVREERRATLVVITSDRGLCGSFNANVLREATRWLASGRWEQVDLVLVGRKGVDFFKHRGVTPLAAPADLLANPSPASAFALGEMLANRYAKGETDAVYVLSNRFRSVIQQAVVLARLLPIEREQLAGATPVGYLCEPAPAVLLDQLLPRYVEVEVLRALLSSVAAEHGARMTAMGAATKNAAEMIEKLTLTYNRVRQAAITKELIEIVSGAQALAEG